MQAAELVPSQILWINIPSLSKLHWHPVSIAHVDLDDPKDQSSNGSVTVHFKAYGAWTKVYCYILCLSCSSSSLRGRQSYFAQWC